MTSTPDARGLTALADARHDRSSAAVTAPRSRWVIRLLLPGILMLLIAAILLLTAFESFLPSTDVRVVPVILRAVEGSVGSVSVQAPGWIEPDPHANFVSALVDGTIEEVLVLEGDRVTAGQVVMRLVADDARIGARHAEAELRRRAALRDVAAADFEAARTRLAELVEMTLAVDVAMAETARARAELDRGKAEVEIAQTELATIADEHDRKAKLVESEAVSAATVARLALRVDGKHAAVRAATSELAVLEAKLRSAEAVLTAATRNRELLIEERRAVAVAEAGLGAAQAAVDVAEAAREDAALQLARTDVRAPVDGVVLRRLVSPGTTLMREGGPHAAHVLHLYDPAHLQVRVDVPLADAARVGVGQRAEIIVEVLPDRVFAGRVTRVVHEADIQKNTVEVKVAVDAPSSELKPEMLARVQFLASETADAGGGTRERLFAPARLVQTGETGGSTLAVVTDRSGDHGIVALRPVTVGRRVVDGWVEIEGLQPGDLVVAEPSVGLSDGQRIRVVGEQAPMEGGG